MAEGKGRTHIVALAAAGVVAVGIVAGVLIASQRPEKRFEAAALETETRETETHRETETSAAETETAVMTAATAPATTAATEGAPPVTAVATAAPVAVTAAATVAADYSRTMYVSHCAQSISLRESPTTAARAVKQIPFAAPVTVLETADNGFYKVIYNGTTGYSLASYLINYQPDESERLDKPDYVLCELQRVYYASQRAGHEGRGSRPYSARRFGQLCEDSRQRLLRGDL